MTFNPSALRNRRSATIPAPGGLVAVACPSAEQCTVVDTGGGEVTFDPTAPGRRIRATIDGTRALKAVACPATGQCTAVDYEGRAVTFNPAAPGSRASTMIAGADSLNAIACRSVARCVTVDSVGNAFLGTVPRGLPAPSRAEITGLLREQLAPSGKAAKIPRLLKRGGYPVGFIAPAAGRLMISWYVVTAGAPRATGQRMQVLIATGRLSFSSAGTRTVKIALTAAGRRRLRHAKRLELNAAATFTPRRQRTVVATRKFSLQR